MNNISELKIATPKLNSLFVEITHHSIDCGTGWINQTCDCKNEYKKPINSTNSATEIIKKIKL